MKPGILLLLLFPFFRIFPAGAQERYGIYIQSADRIPFFAKINGNVFSSSPSGYVTVSGIDSGICVLGIGFSSDNWGFGNYVFRRGLKDEGFLLQKSESGYDLVNIRNGIVIHPGGGEAEAAMYTDDEFVNVLADVVNNPALKRRAVSISEGAAVSKQATAGTGSYFRAGCKKPVSDSVFMAIRRAMAMQSDEDSMMQLAARVLHRGVCLYARQAKVLATLFLDESARMDFTVMAYGLVYDPDNFWILRVLFTEPEMLDRFRLLIKNN